MGVLGLWQIIDSVGHPIKLEALEGKRMGVDANIWLYKFIRGFREKDNASSIDSHKLGLFNRISKLLYYKIRPVFVFDGPAPVLKRKTLERRQDTRNKNVKKAQHAAMKLLAQQLKEQYPDANIDELKIHVPDLTSHNLVAAEKLTDDDRELFYLPPEKKDPVAQTEELYEIDSDDEFYCNKIDLESKDFKVLPPEMRYEILQEEKSKRRAHEPLPEDANDFSKFQLLRLMKRRNIQGKIEECEKEICSSYTGEMSGRSYRVQSDPSKMMLYIEKHENQTYPIVSEAVDKKSKIETPISETSIYKGRSEPDHHVPDEKKIYKNYQTHEPEGVPIHRDVPRYFDIDEHDEDEDDEDEEFQEVVEDRTIEISEDDTQDTIQDDVQKVLKNDVKEVVHDFCDIDDDKFENGKESDVKNSDVQQQQHRPSISTSSSPDQFNKYNNQEGNNKKQQESSQQMLASASSMDQSASSSQGNSVDLVPQSSAPKVTSAQQHHNHQVSAKANQDGKIASEESVEYSMTAPNDDRIGGKNGMTSTAFTSVMPVISSSDANFIGTTTTSSQMSEFEPSLSQDPQPHPPDIPLTQTSSEKITDESESDSDCTCIELSEPQEPVKTNPQPSDPKDSAATKEVENPVESNSRDASNRVGVSRTGLLDGRNQILIPQTNDRRTNKVTNKIVEDAKELLRLFGVPYIEAAGEAEAQCALLESLKLTEGTITDDSDVWLFGSQNVYRHFFSDDKYVLQYKMSDIEFHIRMTRENLVCFAMLVGSDYTDGIMNVGPVTALEILSEFPGEGLDPLINFKNWRMKYDKRNDRVPGSKKREKLLRFELPEEFPSRAVFDGYMRPMADSSSEKFTWGVPELDELREYARRNFGWDPKRTDEKLLPVMKRLSEKKAQTTIDSFFFKRAATQNPELFRSKRVNAALNKMAKACSSQDTVILTEDEDEPNEEDGEKDKSDRAKRKPQPPKRAQKNSRQKATSKRSKKTSAASRKSTGRSKAATSSATANDTIVISDDDDDHANDS